MNQKNSPRRTKKLYLLSKLLVCGHDNRRMQASSRPAEGGHRECKYYFCNGIRKEVAAVRCPSSSVSESRIVPPIWDKLRELLSDPDTVLAQLSGYRERHIHSDGFSKKRKSLESRIQKLTARRRRLVELYLGDAVNREFFQTERRHLDGEIQGHERELTRLRESIISQEELLSRAKTVHTLYASYQDRLKSASYEVKRHIFQTFIKEVVVQGEELEIEVILPDPDSTRTGESTFAGQPPHPLSHKAIPSIFLHAKLVPVSQIFREREMHKNFTNRYA